MLESKRMAAQELKGLDRSSLNDLAEGTAVTFTFPKDCRIQDTLVQAGTTLRLRVQRAEDGNINLVTETPWVINAQTVIKEGSPLPQDILSPDAIIDSPDNRLIVLTVQGAFNLYLKVSFYGAVFFSVPFLLVQAWGFISPGLYPHEKKYAWPFLFMASFFFLLGVAFAYWVAFPRAANFLLGVAAGGNLRPQVTADDYFDLIIMIMLGLGIVFEIPTITFIMSRLGLLTAHTMLKIWRFAVVGIFILAAVLSPTTDIPNMLVFAIPMLILYFFSVGIAWICHRERKPE
jgi:sec-independent protein translocase protein TatC